VGYPSLGNVRRAYRVAAGDGGQPLDVHTEQVGEGRGLGLAQLRKLLCHVRDRAVVLTQLRTGTDVLGRRSVTFGAQSDRQQSRPRDRIGRSGHLGPVPIDQVRYPALGERADRLLSVTLGQKAQRGHRQIVVGVLELRPAGSGEQEHLGRATTAPGTSARCRTVAGLPVRQQDVEVAAHRGGAQPQRVGDLRGRHWSVLQQHPCHRLAGAAVGPDVFHNVHVTYFSGTCKTPACSVGSASDRTATLRTVVAGMVRGVTAGISARFRVSQPAAKAPVSARSGTMSGGTGLDLTETDQLDAVRRFGTVGALLMGLGSLGAGTAPVLGNPVVGRRVLGLFNRMPTASLAVAYTGIVMVVLAWLWLGALAAPGRARLITRAQLDRTMLMWAAPLLVAPPMFSRDVYSYLAQSAMVNRGLDPYVLGPAAALGVDHPLVRGIPTIWRNTPAPYGPLFLTLGRPIDWIAGDDVVLGVLLHRTLAVAGLIMIVWALPRLARRVRVSPVFALWLGAANPLVLFHLVSGVHNEALMIGLMLVGLELALRSPAIGRPVIGPALLGGTALIAAAAQVKVPAALALGFVIVWFARRRGGQLRDLVRVAAAVGGVAVATLVAIGLGTGLGFGWTTALGTPNAVRSWMSVMTELGLLAGWIGSLLGLGDHTTSVLALTRSAGLAAACGMCSVLLWRCWRGRIEPLSGLGVGLGAVVLLGPVVHPWYLLWAAIPLAGSATRPAFRTTATVASAWLAVVVAPTGSDFLFRAWVVPSAIAAAAVTLIVPMLLVRGRTPPLFATVRASTPGSGGAT
jgi:alpha-1,6-mannosyltransferase